MKITCPSIVKIKELFIAFSLFPIEYHDIASAMMKSMLPIAYKMQVIKKWKM